MPFASGWVIYVSESDPGDVLGYSVALARNWEYPVSRLRLPKEEPTVVSQRLVKSKATPHRLILEVTCAENP